MNDPADLLRKQSALLEDILRLALLCGAKIVTAESCTGGLLGGALTSLSGASGYFRGSVVAYDNEVKREVLKVPAKVIDEHGAVSQETALAMAAGAKELLKGTLAISTTGIAGPGGGSAKKPVGLVWIGLASDLGMRASQLDLSGDRETIRRMSVVSALQLACDELRLM